MGRLGLAYLSRALIWTKISLDKSCSDYPLLHSELVWKFWHFTQNIFEKVWLRNTPNYLQFRHMSKFFVIFKALLIWICLDKNYSKALWWYIPQTVHCIYMWESICKPSFFSMTSKLLVYYVNFAKLNILFNDMFNLRLVLFGFFWPDTHPPCTGLVVELQLKLQW